MRWDLMAQPVGENPLKLKEYFFSLLLSYTKKKTPNNPKPLTRQQGHVSSCLLSGVPSKYHTAWKKTGFPEKSWGCEMMCSHCGNATGEDRVFSLPKKIYQLGTSTLIFIFPKECNAYCPSFFPG